MSHMNTSKRISAVIFDCDGVMFDSRQANINFYNHLLDQFGLPPMREESTSFVHMHTADASVRHIFRGTPYVEQAQAYRMQLDYGLFIKDMIMEPGIDGLDTYKKILKLHPGQKVIIASGFSETDRVKDAQRLGTGAYVKKPYVMEKIGLAVKEEL